MGATARCQGALSRLVVSYAWEYEFLSVRVSEHPRGLAEETKASDRY